MKRDMELIRTILLEVNNYNKPALPRIELDEYPGELVDYHVELLVEAGLLKTGARLKTAGGWGDWTRISLTWDGHEFIDNAKNEEVWEKFKQIVAEKGGSISIAVATSVLASLAKQAFGLP
jgi:hypothetical protein